MISQVLLNNKQNIGIALGVSSMVMKYGVTLREKQERQKKEGANQLIISDWKCMVINSWIVCAYVHNISSSFVIINYFWFHLKGLLFTAVGYDFEQG